MIDDATVFRLGAGQLPVRRRRRLRRRLAARAGGARSGLRVWVKPSTDQLHNLAVQGPSSRELLRASSGPPPTQTAARRADVVPVLAWRGSAARTASRSSCRAPATPASWATRSGATRGTVRRCGTRSGRPGAAHGLTPLGLDALDMVRIEAGLIFAGYEFDDQIDPFEAGIGFTVGLRQRRGLRRPRGAARSAAAHPQRVLVGLELEGNETGGARRPRLRRAPAGRRRHERHPIADAEDEHRALPDGGAAPRSSGPRWRWASSTGTRSGSRPRWSGSRSTTRTRRDPARSDGPHDRRSFTDEQVEAFHRDGFLIVERGVRLRARRSELLRERYRRLFDGEYETGIKPDEVNWVKGRDPEDRTRQLCNGVAGRHRDRRAGAVASEPAASRRS